VEYNKTKIPYGDTGAFGKIAVDYINGKSDLRSFYREPFKLENIPQSIVGRIDFDKSKRETLVNVLHDQYQGLSMSAATKDNLKKLAETNCFTITTGHQLNLFTGPLYFIYKIVHCIKLAKACSEKYSDHEFVPVYWMHTEDHDIAEINHFKVFGKQVNWTSASEGVAGELPTESLSIILFQLKDMLGDGTKDEEILRLLKESYTGNDNLAAATRHFTNRLFGEHGLLILDPRDKRLKAQFTKVFEDDLSKHNLYKKVKSTSEDLDKRGYKVQALPRALNTFYLHEGKREKILYLDSVDKYQFESSGTVFEEKEILDLVRTNPERFSPNVLLRPLYQESILPNLVYIGGGGELAYWLQLKAAFTYFQVPFPLLAMRNSVLWIDKKHRERMDGFKLKTTDLFGDTDALITRLTRAESEGSLLEAESKELERIFNQILTKAKSVNPSMERTVMGEFKKQFKAIQNLEGKILREVKRQNETELNRLRKVKSKLFPDDSLQERKDNVIEYWSKYGKEFIEVLFKELEPENESFLVLSEK